MIRPEAAVAVVFALILLGPLVVGSILMVGKKKGRALPIILDLRIAHEARLVSIGGIYWYITYYQHSTVLSCQFGTATSKEEIAGGYWHRVAVITAKRLQIRRTDV